MTSFTEDMRRRGMQPSSRTLELRITPAGARLGRLLHVSPSEPVVVVSRLRLADGETMAIETAARSRDARSGAHRARPRGALLLRAPQRSLRDRDRRRRADDRADRHERGRSRRRSASRSTRRRSCSSGRPARRPARSSSSSDSIYRGDRYRLVTELQPSERRRARAQRASTDGRNRSSWTWSVPRSRRDAVARLCLRMARMQEIEGHLQSGLDSGTRICANLPAVADWYKPIGRRSRPWSPATLRAANTGRPGCAWEIAHESTHFAAAALVAALAVVAAGATGASGGSAAQHSITVWLQTDAQSGWPERRGGRERAFKDQTPGRRRRTSSTRPGAHHLGKFDATLAGGNAPDVIEMGNTEMTKYMAAGAFQDLTSSKSSFPNSSTWLEGLAASGRYSGKLYGVPYYAGSRVVTYRTDLFKQGRRSRSRRASRSSRAGEEARREEHSRRASRPSTSPAPTGTSR